MLTPSERRGALVVLALIALGTAWDLWRASHPRWRLLSGPFDGVTATPGMSDRDPADPGKLDRDRPRPRGAAEARDSLPAAAPAGRGKRPPGRPLDLNQAGPEEFHTLPGIGPVLAQR